MVDKRDNSIEMGRKRPNRNAQIVSSQDVSPSRTNSRAAPNEHEQVKNNNLNKHNLVPCVGSNYLLENRIKNPQQASMVNVIEREVLTPGPAPPQDILGARNAANLTPHTLQDQNNDGNQIATPNQVMGGGLINPMQQPSEERLQPNATISAEHPGNWENNSNTINTGGVAKKQSKMLPGDEIVKYITGKDGKRKKVVKRIIKEKVYLTQEQVDEIHEAFKLFDKDGSNNIDTEELKDAMRALGFVYDKKKVKELMEQADKDGSGQIDKDEFQAIMARFISQRNPKDELEKAFKMYDDDDNGTISEENLIKVAQDLEQDVTEDEIRLMLKIGDRFNRYGGEEVDFEDFMYIMLQAKLYTEDNDKPALHMGTSILNLQQNQ